MASALTVTEVMPITWARVVGFSTSGIFTQARWLLTLKATHGETGDTAKPAGRSGHLEASVQSASEGVSSVALATSIASIAPLHRDLVSPLKPAHSVFAGLVFGTANWTAASAPTSAALWCWRRSLNPKPVASIATAAKPRSRVSDKDPPLYVRFKHWAC